MFISVDSSIIGELFEILFLALRMQGKIHRAALYNWNHPENIILKVFFVFFIAISTIYYLVITQYTQLKPNCSYITGQM